MFHSVGLENLPWEWSYISESLRSFEAKIAGFKRLGFNGILWNELYEYMAGRLELPKNSILLTFDDGYLDNWVYVYPILKKYGMKGTIFVSPDFVDPRTDIRLNLDDVTAGRCKPEELSEAGFLSWAEMREMEKTGIIDIQSHAMTHTWYFSGPKVVDFHRPHDVTPHPWLFWNERPERKPYYLTEDQQRFLPWGYPILENQKSLVATRFFPDPDAMAKITGHVDDQGGADFFERPDWRELLLSFVAKTFDDSKLPGTYESDGERFARINDEVGQSKKLIEENLNKSVEFVCWPGGANAEDVQKMAIDAGYKSWTLDSRTQGGKRNHPGAEPSNIKRIGTSNQVIVKGRQCGSGGAYYQTLRVLAHQGSLRHSLTLKAYKLASLAKSLL